MNGVTGIFLGSTSFCKYLWAEEGEEVNICSLNRDIFALSKTNIFEAVPIREDTGTARHLHFWKL
jgi:hypothetical protein